ncbi:serine hydrolase domain-containing protein [Hymenobacter rigui]|uniref:Class A beta-lactamase-related serine hydrolase n=1 Tax=Hymenobacter rigui TaxID=334424 RepID=A0A428KVZ9_9BACT|nr:serine hydrolase domain-containing protein [Hymenobacter rigui]RSK50929.1 class A beta-lactamase-related serine hydrolase [Hymenobacter rigui]
MLRASISLLALPLLWAGTVTAQTALPSSFNKAKLDSLLTVLDAKHKLAGSLQLTQNGQVVYSRAIGPEQPNVPATTATRYRIGSISKTFTATIIMQLVEEGKLKLNAPIATWFPDLPNASTITVDQLLHHRSGLGDFTRDPAYVQYMTQPKTQAELLALIRARPVEFEPGARYDYNNSNYVLLGYVVEKVTRQPYAQALQKRITGKLGLKNTYYGGRLNSQQHEAASFVWDGATWQIQRETDMSIPGGAGAITSTPADLTRFLEGLFAGKLVKPATLQQMQVMQDGYGVGMRIVPFGNQQSYGHFGSIDGYRSALTYFPADKLTVAYCGNGSSPDYTLSDLLVGTLSIYFNKPYRLPDFNAPKIEAADLTALVGNYASTQMPLKINVTANGTTLMAQATGQSAFPLTAKSRTTFVYDAAGLTMEFDAAARTFMLHQGANHFLFTRQ